MKVEGYEKKNQKILCVIKVMWKVYTEVVKGNELNQSGTHPHYKAVSQMLWVDHVFQPMIGLSTYLVYRDKDQLLVPHCAI